MCKIARRIIEDLMVERLEKNRLMAVSGMSIEELTDAFTQGHRLVSPEAIKDDIPDDSRIMPKNGGDEDAIEFSEEDAIKMLKSKMDDHTDTSYEWAETVRMSIKALKQEPILDKIRAEIETKYGRCNICEYFEDYDHEENDISEYRPIGDIADILQIIDKYKAESEE